MTNQLRKHREFHPNLQMIGPSLSALFVLLVAWFTLNGYAKITGNSTNPNWANAWLFFSRLVPILRTERIIPWYFPTANEFKIQKRGIVKFRCCFAQGWVISRAFLDRFSWNDFLTPPDLGSINSKRYKITNTSNSASRWLNHLWFLVNIEPIGNLRIHKPLLTINRSKYFVSSQKPYINRGGVIRTLRRATLFLSEKKEWLVATSSNSMFHFALADLGESERNF